MHCTWHFRGLWAQGKGPLPGESTGNTNNKIGPFWETKSNLEKPNEPHLSQVVKVNVKGDELC